MLLQMCSVSKTLTKPSLSFFYPGEAMCTWSDYQRFIYILIRE